MSELAQSIADRPESLVTVLGAAGFVGSAVVAELARLRLRLRLVSRERSLPPPPPPSLVESRTADLAEAHAVRDVVTGSDAIIHLATDIGGKRPWRAPGTDFERLNAGLINTLVESARQCSASPPVVVFASTIQASAPPERRVGEYVRQKMAAENLL